MRDSFDNYFSGGNSEAREMWIINPFIFNYYDFSDDKVNKEDIIEIQSSQLAKLIFADTKSLEIFWLEMNKQFSSFPN